MVHIDFPGGSDGKASAYNFGDLGSIPGQKDPLKKEIAAHSSTLAWKIPWMEEPCKLQFRRPRGATPCSRSEGVAVRRYPSSKVRSSGCALLEQL